MTAVTPDFVRQCLDAESEGDAALLLAMFRRVVRYCTNEATWYVYADGLWRRDEAMLVFALVSHVVDAYGAEYNRAAEIEDEDIRARRQTKIERRIKSLRKPAGRNACLEFAWKGKPIAVTSADFDATPYLLGVRNGTLDLRTGMLLESRPEDMITRQTGCAYRDWAEIPQEQRDVVTTFFSDIWGDDADKIEFARRLLGQALIGEVVNHVFPFFLGRRSRNGKSVLCTLLLHVWGDYGITFNAEMLYASFNSRANSVDPDIVEFDGARLAISSEVTDGAVFSADRIKRMTGGDRLKGRNPYELNRTFKPSHLMIMLGNHEPTAPVGDPGFWERTLLFEFPYKFTYAPDPDPAKKERQRIDRYEDVLIAADEAFLAWFVAGAIAYQADGRRLRPPESVVKATKEYQEDSDWITQWASACTVESPAAKTRSSTLYNIFVIWYRENVNNRHIPSQTRFGKKMRETGRWEWKRESDATYFYGLEPDPVWARRLWEGGTEGGYVD